MQSEAGHHEVVVIGAGFGGVYALHRLRQAGFQVQCIEAAAGVGGVWYWNRYPGARCDVESLQYSYAFDEGLQQEWEWSERFATQPEILSYIEHVAERFDLYRDIRFETRITAASFDASGDRWTLTTDAGDTISTRFVVMATGALSASKLPDIEGLETFSGRILHTGQWPHETVDFTGQRVAVIGTGSSGIQAIPRIAEQAAHLTVFQRTPSFSVPARNGPLPPDYVAGWKRDYKVRREEARRTRSGMLYDYGQTSAMSATAEERAREYEARWEKGSTNFLYAYNDIVRNDEANRTAADFVRSKIAEAVHDPDVADRLSPKDYPIGAKRICVDTDYYSTFNRDNVSLVDIRATSIERITPAGIETTDTSFDLDAIVFATGFDALTGALLSIDIQGTEGRSLRDAWAQGPRTYLGLMTAGFPNLFIVTGPGSPSVLSNMVLSVEHDAEWITDCLIALKRKGATRIEADAAAQDAWVAENEAMAGATLYAKGNSWYRGANIPGKPQTFMPYLGGVDQYQRLCREAAESGYRGFLIDGDGVTDATANG